MQLAHSNTLDAVRSLGTGNPDAIVDGMIALQHAKTAQAVAVKVSQISQDMDAAILDMLV